MVLGINDNTFLSDSDRVRPFMLEMGRSNPSWEVHQAILLASEGEGVVRSPPAKKMKASASSSQRRRKPPRPQVALRSLINEEELSNEPLNQNQSELSEHAPLSFPSHIHIVQAIADPNVSLLTVVDKLVGDSSLSRNAAEEDDDNIKIIKIDVNKTKRRMQREQVLPL